MKRVETNESAVKCLDWWKKARQTEARTSEVRGEYNCGRSLTPKLSLLSSFALADAMPRWASPSVLLSVCVQEIKRWG